MNRSLNFTCLQNARQLGGYRTIDGRSIKENLLLRCGQLNCASEEELQQLHDIYHVETVIDLRTSRERENAPDPEIHQAMNIWLPVLNENQKADVDLEKIRAYTLEYGDNPAAEAVAILRCGYDPSMIYKEMLQDPYSKNQFRLFFTELSKMDDKNAILWHCSGGKDRAGTAAALILIALGVDEKTILDDFELSNAYYAERIELMTMAASELTDDQRIIKGTAAFAGVDRNYMKNALQWMKDAYGSSLSYLTEGLSISEAEILTLRQRYTQSNKPE